jgi:hypothetical protein
MEKRSIKHPDWDNETELIAERYCVLEVRDKKDRQALTLPPVTAGDLSMWEIEIDSRLGFPTLNKSQPLVGEDYELKVVGDGRQGLGVQNSLLTPTVPLVALLNLHPGSSFNYEDKDGIGLALLTWRAEYDTSDYYLTWHRIFGSGIVIRPDLFTQLVSIVGEQRLILRDFVTGDIGLLST